MLIYFSQVVLPIFVEIQSKTFETTTFILRSLVFFFFVFCNNYLIQCLSRTDLGPLFLLVEPSKCPTCHLCFQHHFSSDQGLF